MNLNTAAQSARKRKASTSTIDDSVHAQDDEDEDLVREAVAFFVLSAARIAGLFEIARKSAFVGFDS